MTRRGIERSGIVVPSTTGNTPFIPADRSIRICWRHL
jgi:hypothetical protein